MDATPDSEEQKRKLSEVDRDKFLVRIEDKVRRTSVREVMANAIMSDRQWSIFIRLKRELATRGLTILAGVPLTAIIDPKLYRFPDALWRSSVLFAVVTKAPRGAVRLLVLDTKEIGMEQCLDRLKIQHIPYNALLNEVDFAKNVLDEIDFQFQSSISAKYLINPSENDVADSLRSGVLSIEFEQWLINKQANEGLIRDFENNSIKLLHEVALHRICTSDLIRSSLTSDEDHIRVTSSVDILLHSPPPLNLPLLAIEFDGPHHDDSRQHRKDLLKNSVLAHYRIPLIRISHADAAFGNLLRYGKTDWHRLYVEGLTALVGAVLFLKKFEDDFAVRADRTKRALHNLEDRLSQSIFGKPFVELNNDQRKRVNELTLSSKELEDCEYEESLFDFELNQFMEWNKIQWPIELIQYSSCPEIHGDGLTGFFATFKVKIPNKEYLEITLPRILVQAKSLDGEILKACVRARLIQIAADFVRQIIRMNTPAVRR